MKKASKKTSDARTKTPSQIKDLPLKKGAVADAVRGGVAGSLPTHAYRTIKSPSR